MTREELIAALERAEGPSRELDEEIMCCVYADLKPEQHMEGWYSAAGDHIRVDRYTSSLDAALTLVPDGAMVTFYRERDGTGDARVSIAPGDDDEIGGGTTPAIALCIAALKARA